jgi:hypothetical protein
MVDDGALERALKPALGDSVRVVVREPWPYASSFPLARLVVEVADGSLHDLMWKDVSRSALTPDGRRARGPAADAASREVDAYTLLAAADLGTPRCIAVACDGDRAWLFLEAIEGPRLDHVGEIDRWRAVAVWLAGAHGVLTACAEEAAWLPRWRPADGRATSHERHAHALAGPLAAARARVGSMPSTVIHGELYPANVLIGAGGRVCVLDWETIARGPALMDLAALTAGRWDEPGEPLVEAYRQALPDPPEPRALREDLDACRLLLAVERMAAPPDWTPPAEQARDWLADAESIARRASL